jgi:glyoxylase I family protein
LEPFNLIIRRIDHIAINVLNIERSIDFYTRILGFEQLQTIDCGDFDITYIALSSGSRLELFDYHAKNISKPRDESDVGLRHLAFEVDDVSSQERYLRSEEVDIILPTCDLPHLGVRVLLCRDPDGVTIEFCQKLKAAGVL